ncbi:pyroglutamyl-peptidase I [Bifidobacterium jacchi]|uniref:Pyroglutamyl-peptidase I n=1 Tax=Bifidobacterium jacchi TaxID=2490545 RepID=A0A5N5RG60_9BIFI|nr:pyroglutamyl-peptidase I [Bifidobacterium jacchi]KAB5606258.1 pyroglutamyl-peptidase I [Bifidobacterium jacchi]
MQQLNVVISGFDHYDGVNVNPAVEVPKALVERGVDLARVGADADADGVFDDVRVNVHAVSIPVSFGKAWPTLREAIDAAKPDIVIATGLKHTARGVMLERCATNLMDSPRPDAENVVARRTPINPDGPAAYWTRLPLRAILKDFTRDHIAASLSSDAGTFVCNSLFYRLMEWTSTQQRVLSGFVSLPLIDHHDKFRHGLSLEQLIAAGRDVVGETVRYYLEPSSGDILID